MREKRKHWAECRAWGDGWDIEALFSNGIWLVIPLPLFNDSQEYRVVPDEDGWLPWYDGMPMPEVPNGKVIELRYQFGLAGISQPTLSVAHMAVVIAYRFREEDAAMTDPLVAKQKEMAEFEKACERSGFFKPRRDTDSICGYLRDSDIARFQGWMLARSEVPQ